MADTKIDERKILEWAGFKLELIPKPRLKPDESWWVLRENSAMVSAGNPDLYSLDWQAKYLWPKLVALYDINLWSDNGFWFFIARAKEMPYDTEMASIIGVENPAEACLLAIQDMLDSEGQNAKD